MEKNKQQKSDLLQGFLVPANVSEPTLFPFKSVEEFFVTLEVSKDELNRWFEKGWISFEPGKHAKFDEAEYLEAEFVKSLAQSGQSDEWITKLLSTLEPPYSYNIRNMAYSFATKCWVQVPTEEEIEEIITEHLDGYLSVLPEDELEELKETIEGLLENECDD